MSKFDKQPSRLAHQGNRRVRGPLEVKIFALRRGYEGKIGRHVTEPMLARVLGCTHTHYQRMEKGKHPFKDEHLRRLADYYGADFNELKQLRAIEQLLFRVGFPNKDPRPLLRSALDYADSLLPV